jgi:hypothetical protein
MDLTTIVAAVAAIAAFAAYLMRRRARLNAEE